MSFSLSAISNLVFKGSNLLCKEAVDVWKRLEPVTFDTLGVCG